MKLSNGIKKLEKYTKVEKNGGEYSGVIGGYVVSFMSNGGYEGEEPTICYIGVRNKNDRSNSMIDYCAETFYPNLTMAIKSVLR